MAAGDITKAMRDRVRTLLGEISRQGLDDSEIFLHMNRGALDVGWRLADAALPEMTKVASGNLSASAITLPSDFWRERIVQVGSALATALWWPVTKLDALSNDTQYQPSLTEPYAYLWPPAASEPPAINLLVGNPASTDPYQLYYQAQPVPMSGSVDPVYNETTCDAIVLYTVGRFREQAQDFEESERVFRQYRDLLEVVNSRFAEGARHEGIPS